MVAIHVKCQNAWVTFMGRVADTKGSGEGTSLFLWNFE